MKEEAGFVYLLNVDSRFFFFLWSVHSDAGSKNQSSVFFCDVARFIFGSVSAEQLHFHSVHKHHVFFLLFWVFSFAVERLPVFTRLSRYGNTNCVGVVVQIDT